MTTFDTHEPGQVPHPSRNVEGGMRFVGDVPPIEASVGQIIDATYREVPPEQVPIGIGRAALDATATAEVGHPDRTPRGVAVIMPTDSRLLKIEDNLAKMEAEDRLKTQGLRQLLEGRTASSGRIYDLQDKEPSERENQARKARITAAARANLTVLRDTQIANTRRVPAHSETQRTSR